MTFLKNCQIPEQNICLQTNSISKKIYVGMESKYFEMIKMTLSSWKLINIPRCAYFHFFKDKSTDLLIELSSFDPLYD